MSINIEELKRLHGKVKETKWSYEPADMINCLDADLICYLRNNCEEIIEALEFARNRSEEKVK